MLHGTTRAWAVAPRARRAETVGCGRSASTRPTIATSSGARDRVRARATAGCASARRRRRRDHAPLGGPGRGERRRVEGAGAEHLLRRGPVRLRLREVDLEVGRHLVGDRIGNAETLPLAAALLDERVHAATSASTGPSTASSASRAARHSATPAASARRPSGKAVVLARRPAVARGAIGLDEPLTLEAAEQRVDRALADGREAAGAQPLRHLVAVRRPLLHHREQTEVERPAQELRAASLANCHASQGSSICLALQGKPSTVSAA